MLHVDAVAFWAPDLLLIVIMNRHDAAELVAALFAFEFIGWHKHTPHFSTMEVLSLASAACASALFPALQCGVVLLAGVT
jgi:hypothetical protein